MVTCVQESGGAGEQGSRGEHLLRPSAPPLLRLARSLMLTLLISMGGAALAHATLVLVTLNTDPVAPVAGEPFGFTLEMTDPTEFPIEDALVVADFTGTDGEMTSATFTETDTPGVYETEVTLPEAGDYTLLLRDQTFRQEEARVSQEITLGDGPLFPEGENSLIFPPTAITSSSSLRAWLIWLIALPIVAGIVVTVLVLRGTSTAEKSEDTA